MINSKKPSIDERASGIVENAVIPSREYKNNFQNDHFVFPATRSSVCNLLHRLQYRF